MGFARNIVRRLQARYGRDVTIATPTAPETVNLETGKVNRPVETTELRALVFPGDSGKQHFTLDTKPATFSYGGNFETQTLRVIFKIAANITQQTILFDTDHAYSVVSINKMESEFWDVVFKRIENSDYARQRLTPVPARQVQSAR